jgi:RNA polymerase sigma-70 factor (ECF subfamily)
MGVELNEGALEGALVDLATKGRAAWPDVPLGDDALAAYLGARAPASGDVLAWLGTLRPSDIFLACAATQGQPRALAAFDAALLSKVALYLSTIHATPELVAETRQRLLEKLFVGNGSEPPRIHRFEARGSLDAWVRISAVRTALDLMDAERAASARPDEAEELARVLVPGADPELALIRATYKEEFTSAFREAIAGLAQRDRQILRYTFIERLVPARIAVMYHVHRTTVLRWIQEVEDEVLRHTHARLRERLRISPSECDRVVELVRSAIDASLSSLLRTPP